MILHLTFRKYTLVVAGFVLCGVLFGADYCSPDGRNATWYGLKGSSIKAPIISFAKNAVKATVVAKGPYQGISCDLDKMVDIRNCSAIEFEIKQGYYYKKKAACVLRLEFEKATSGPVYIYRDFNSGTGDWTPVSVPFDPHAWKAYGKLAVQFRKVKTVALYPYSAMNVKGKFIMLRNLKFIKRQLKSTKIGVNDYKYLEKPTSGDKKATVLTDGIIDVKQQAFWRQYASAPEIIFDLGGIFLVDKIKIDAFAAPSHNISNITFLSSTDGKNWSPATEIENQQKGVAARHQVLNKSGQAIAGRYIKMLVQKERPDHKVYISEVSFFGRIPSKQELRQTIAAKYHVGPVMSPVSPQNYASIKQSGIKINVSRKNGVINTMTFKGDKIAERIYDSYTLSSLKKDITTNSYLDKVRKINATANSITVTAVNPKLPGIDIIKTFKLENGALVRNIKFISRDFNGKAFLKTQAVVVLNQKFRNAGIYETSGASHSLERMFASEVITRVKASRQPTLSFEHPNKKLTLLHYRYKYNNKFIYLDSVAENEKSTTFTPTGWAFTSAVFQFNDKSRCSVTNRMDIVQGNLYDAYIKYINLPGPKKFRAAIKRPEWLRDIAVNSALGWDGLWKGAEIRRMGRYVKMLRSGYILEPGICDMDFIWGEFPTRGEVRNWFGGKQTPAALKNKIKRLKELAPGRIKIGIYTWLWSAFPYSEPCQKNPEWFVWKHRNGADASWFPGVNRNYLRFWGIKASRDDAIRRIVEMMNYYKLDVWYLDGGNSGGYTRDWQTMRQDDPLGATKLYTDMRKAIKQTDPDRIVFFNAPCNPLGDLGFLESFSGVMTSKWRKGAAWMWKFKLFQVNDPLHHPLYIYWLPGVEGAYENYIVGLGMVPSYSSREMRAKDVPYLTARYENRTATLVNGQVKPDWRSDPNTLLECYSLKNGTAGLVFIKSHAKKIQNETVSVLTTPLGLTQDRDVYSWCMTVRNAKKWDGRFGELELTKLYGPVQWAPDRVATVNFYSPAKVGKRIARNFKTVPDELKLWVTTHVPVFIWSTQGMRTQLWLPERPKLKLAGKIRENKISVNSYSEFNVAEIALIIPPGKEPDKVTRNGRDWSYSLVRSGDTLLAIVRISKGKHKIVVSLKKASAPASKPKIVITGLAPSNKEIQVETGDDWEGKKVCAKIELDDAIIWSASTVRKNNKFTFTLRKPKSLRAGNYKVTVSDVTGKKSSIINWKVKGGRPETVLPYGVLPILSVKKQVINKQLAVKGLNILASGIEYTEGAGNAVANPEKASVSVGMPEMYTSHYNLAAAGLKLQAKRYIKIRVSGNFEYFNRIGLQPGRHFIRHGKPSCFAGMMLDFGTNKGFTTRSAVGLGKINEKKADPMPNAWGSKKKPNYFFALNDYIHGKNKAVTCWLDLHQFGAPTNWNGSLWLTAMVQYLCPDRNMTISIMETKDTLPKGAKIDTPHNLIGARDKKIFEFPRTSGKINLETSLNAPGWKNAPEYTGFNLLHSSFRKSTQRTKFKLARDDKNIYLAITCFENEKKALNCEMGKIGKPWHGDSIEFFFTIGSGKDIAHAVIDAEGNTYQAVEGPGKVGGKKTKIKWIKYKVKQYPGYWVVTAAVPLTKLQVSGKKGTLTGFNVMRNRLKNSKTEHLSFVPGKSYFTGRQYQLKFKEK
jgi:F5/8 type C domain/Carbohydrate family 9 binding domain-like